MLFALITDAPRVVSQGDLFACGMALELHARDVAEAYLVEAPAVVVMDREQLVPSGVIPIVVVDSTSDEGFLAVHYPGGGRVYAPACSGFNDGRYSIVEAFSHELAEALIDPSCNVWLDHPTREGVQVAYECCDPTQDHYYVESKGSRWRVSNFVTPFWFDKSFARFPGAYSPDAKADHLGRLQPGVIGPEGYAVFRKRDEHGAWVHWSEDADGRGGLAERKPHKLSPMARTLRRLDPSVKAAPNA